MSRDLVTLVYSRKVGSLLRKSVLTAMADRANDDGTGIWISKQRIADEIEASRQGVVDAIKDMIEDGILVEVGQRPCANGWTMEYSIAVDVVCALEVRKQHMGDPPKYVGVQKANTPPSPVDPTPQLSGGHPPTGFTQTVLNHPQPSEAKASVDVSASAPARPPKAESVDYVRADRAFQLFVQAATRQRCWSVPEAMNKTRRASLTARVREVGMDGWERAIRRAEQSPFLTGRTGDKPFGLTLDWMLKPANFTKIIEGNYDDRTHHTATGNGSGAGNASRNGSRPDAFDRLAERLSGGPAGADTWQHDDPGTAGGYVIDAGPARRVG